MVYEVVVHEKARRKFDKLRDTVLKERLQELFKLLSEPFNLDTVKIKGEENVYRTRIGKYRVLEVIRDGMVYVVDFDHRGKIYKKL
ncbi:MAG: type II toxin-antitoxin system RelE/ParE family toxin [Candidatus Micrarchaeota archaeon]|nr:type II toxin-antitoxin system RelE/ParE family toxin [Candidatus Micrarchaeota archaeon]